jgi:two-component system, LytTR family, sensor kinase
MVRTVVIGQKKDSAEREVERLQLHNLESQKQMLMQQLQPHFLFNTLSVLKSLIKEDPDAAENYAIQLSDFLRYSVQGHNKSLVTLEEELNFTRDYIQLQQLRFGNAFDCNIQTTTDIDGYKLPTYALQLLVENAIKHNAFTEKRPLKINIVQNGKSVSVCNNKLPVKMTTAGTGTGLSNLMERYQLIANKKVLIEDKTEQFCVHIDLI